tara:strand:- start:8496 stop:9059 length:564 start_codon:yes stop_codon:yes gene_type:complete
MVFHFGAAGTAQQLKAANAGSPPTGVSMDEGTSGGQSPAFKATDSNGIDIMDIEYSDWSSYNSSTNTLSKTVSIGDMGEFDAYEGTALLNTFGYIRATGATSYSWSGSVHSSSLTYANAAVSGAGGGGQDATSGGCGIRFVFEGVAGRGGTLYAANGDTVTYKLTANATNGDGTTSFSLYIQYNFTG